MCLLIVQLTYYTANSPNSQTPSYKPIQDADKHLDEPQEQAMT